MYKSLAGASAGSFAGCMVQIQTSMEQSQLFQASHWSVLSGGGDAGVVSSNHRRQLDCNPTWLKAHSIDIWARPPCCMVR